MTAPDEPCVCGTERCPSEWVRSSTGATLRCEREEGHPGIHISGKGWDQFQWSA